MSKSFIVRLVLWGEGPPAFLGGVLLSVSLNIITGLSLYTVSQWPPNGYLLLLASMAFFVSAVAVSVLSWRIHPLKSQADIRLDERRKRVRIDEQLRDDVQFVWEMVLDSEGYGNQRARKIYIPLILAIGSFLCGIAVYLVTLPIIAK